MVAAKALLRVIFQYRTIQLVDRSPPAMLDALAATTDSDGYELGANENENAATRLAPVAMA